jgi:hypothetical protein
MERININRSLSPFYPPGEPPYYQVQIAAFDYYDLPITPLLPSTMCSAILLTWGRSCAKDPWLGGDCDHDHSMVWVGVAMDAFQVLPLKKKLNKKFNIETLIVHDGQGEVRKTTLHELGHNIGGLLPYVYNPLDIDTYPTKSRFIDLMDRWDYNAARSAMFYFYDAPYFNPDHVYKIRNGLQGCLHHQ